MTLNILALDLSKTRTGWAVHFDGDIRESFRTSGWEVWAEWGVYENGSKWEVFDHNGKITSVAYGSWVLGSTETSRGQVFDLLMRNMEKLHGLTGYQFLYFEQPITPEKLNGYTTIATLRITIGLATAAELFGWVFRYQSGFWTGIRKVFEVNIKSWRPPFIGRDESQAIEAKARHARKNGNPRASASGEFKSQTMDRARQLGFKPRYDDEADAIGILTYAIEHEGFQAPWLADEVLRPPLGRVG